MGNSTFYVVVRSKIPRMEIKAMYTIFNDKLYIPACISYIKPRPPRFNTISADGLIFIDDVPIGGASYMNNYYPNYSKPVVNSRDTSYGESYEINYSVDVSLKLN
jgi:hypothetical protein